MRFFEFDNKTPPETAVTKPAVKQALTAMGYEEQKDVGNVIRILVQIPEGKKATEYRQLIMQDALARLQEKFPQAQYLADPRLGSLGGIVFAGSPIAIVVKDIGKQGANSAGVGNEMELASMLESVIQKYGSANVTFIDERGKKLSIKDATKVETTGKDVKGRKKADVILYSKKSKLPISIKELSAEVWESADSLFGARARQVIDDLTEKGVIKLIKIADRAVKGGSSVPVYKLSKEIVMEPTPEEALAAIFGADINPEGGIVIQDFGPEHFKQDNNNVVVQAHAVIKSWDDIPESHLMVWLIRNDSNRNSASLGIAGLRPLGVTLTRGIGRKGTKDVVLVDKTGAVVPNPNVK